MTTMIAEQFPPLPPIMIVDVGRYRATMPGSVTGYAAPDWMTVYNRPIRRDQIAVMPTDWEHKTTVRPQTALEMLDYNPDVEIYIKPRSRYATPHVRVLRLVKQGLKFMAIVSVSGKIITLALALDTALIVQ